MTRLPTIVRRSRS